MIKDYYLILGVGKDATHDEIGKVYNDKKKKLFKKYRHAYDSFEYKELREAYGILFFEENKVLYDKELEAADESGDYENYEIKNPYLADLINSDEGDDNWKTKKDWGDGCAWLFVIFIIFFFYSTCISPILKEQGRHAVRNKISYVEQ